MKRNDRYKVVNRAIENGGGRTSITGFESGRISPGSMGILDCAYRVDESR